MRVRIGLKKMGQEITPERVEKEAAIIRKNKKDGPKAIQISRADVIAALSAGQEVSCDFTMRLLRVKCLKAYRYSANALCRV